MQHSEGDDWAQAFRRGLEWVRDQPMATTSIKRYALCLKNKKAEDLVVRKLYPVILDERAEKDHHIRVVDESGEDYLYPAGYFFIVE